MSDSRSSLRPKAHICSPEKLQAPVYPHLLPGLSLRPTGGSGLAAAAAAAAVAPGAGSCGGNACWCARGFGPHDCGRGATGGTASAVWAWGDRAVSLRLHRRRFPGGLPTQFNLRTGDCEPQARDRHSHELAREEAAPTSAALTAGWRTDMQSSASSVICSLV